MISFKAVILSEAKDLCICILEMPGCFVLFILSRMKRVLRFAQDDSIGRFPRRFKRWTKRVTTEH
jgi:hypothetical protein